MVMRILVTAQAAGANAVWAGASGPEDVPCGAVMSANSSTADTGKIRRRRRRDGEIVLYFSSSSFSVIDNLLWSTCWQYPDFEWPNVTR